MKTAPVREQHGADWEREIEDLFRDQYAFMYRASQALLQSPTDAEDVIQNLFLKFVQHELRPEVRENPRPYLYRAAVNESLNIIRSRTRRHESGGVEELEVPEPCTERMNDNVKVRLQEAFAQLRPATLEILILHHEHGYSDAEIAEMLGHTRGKVAMILTRARAELQELMSGANASPTGRSQ